MTLAAPVAYVSFHKLIAKRMATLHEQSCCNHYPKSKEEQQRQKDAEGEKLWRQQRREEEIQVAARQERSEER